jgi:hypothetical protein
MIMIDTEAIEGTSAQLPYQPAVVKFAFSVRAFGRSAQAIISSVSPWRCRSLIVPRNRALMLDDEKDGRRGQIRTLNAERRTLRTRPVHV